MLDLYKPACIFSRCAHKSFFILIPHSGAPRGVHILVAVSATRKRYPSYSKPSLEYMEVTKWIKRR